MDQRELWLRESEESLFGVYLELSFVREKQLGMGVKSTEIVPEEAHVNRKYVGQKNSKILMIL